MDNNDRYNEEENDEMDEILYQHHLGMYQKELEEIELQEAIEYYNFTYDDLHDLKVDDIIEFILDDIDLYDEDSFENPFEEEHAHYKEMLHFLVIDEKYDKCIRIKQILDEIELAYAEYLAKDHPLEKVITDIFGNKK